MPEIHWLGKWLVLSRDGAGVFSKGDGGAALLGRWIGAAVVPLTRKHARRILGRFIGVFDPLWVTPLFSVDCGPTDSGVPTGSKIALVPF